MSGDRERTFAMFCTIGIPVIFAEVDDEIAAVSAFRQHVAVCGDSHIPHMHMEPMRAEWEGVVVFERTILSTFGPNLFRQPAESRP